jgi:Uma2 family endonuclease
MLLEEGTPMGVDVTKKLFTVDEYYKMAEAGIFGESHRVELIDGEVIEMSAIGHRHLGCVNCANTLFIESFGRRAVVSPQNPILISIWTEPQPDLVVLKPRKDFYRRKKPEPADALFVVEVADTSISYDRDVKVPRYAAAGVPEVWIEDLNNDQLLVYRSPAANRYSLSFALQRGDSVSPLAFPDVTFTIEDLLGESS